METLTSTSLSLNFTIDPSPPLTKPQMDSTILDLMIEHQPQPQPNDGTSISILVNVQLTIELQPQPQPHDETSTLT